MHRLLVLVLLAACGNGGGDQCRVVPDAGGAGVTGDNGDQQFTFGRFNSSPNNDCPAGGTSVVSVTIEAEQVGPVECSPRCVLNLCLPRPDLIGDAPIALGDADLVRVDSLAASLSLCETVVDRRAPPTGTVTFQGFCTTAGSHYVVSFDGAVPATRTCGDGPTVETTMTLTGAADVAGL